MTNDIEQVAVLIPAYNPDEKLVTYVGELLAADFTQIIVVDDGSRKECEQYFEQIEQEHEVTVLHHKENQGKGVEDRIYLLFGAFSGLCWCCDCG